MHTTELTIDNFESLVVDGDGIVFIDWWAAWCGPCRAFAPVYEAAAARHPDITWGKIDTEASPDLAGQFGIRAIPTLMVFREGVLLFEQPGMLPAQALDSLAEQVRTLDMEEVRRKIEEHEAAHARAG